MRKQKLTISEILALFWGAPSRALFDQDVIAIILDCSPASLERSRWSGIGGPPFKKIGTRSVRYEKQSVIDWLSQSPLQNSTTHTSA
jgi:hypothetical protein